MILFYRAFHLPGDGLGTIGDVPVAGKPEGVAAATGSRRSWGRSRRPARGGIAASAEDGSSRLRKWFAAKAPTGNRTRGNAFREGAHRRTSPPEPGGDPERGRVLCLPCRSLGVAGRFGGPGRGLREGHRDSARIDLPDGPCRQESSGSSSRISCFDGRSASARRRSRMPSRTRSTCWSSASRRGWD